MTFEECFDIVLDLEGGDAITDDVRDPGGLTKFGISLKAHPELTPKALRNLTKAQARAIYKADYWDKIQVSKLPLRLRLAMFDSAVNHGILGASKILQKAMNREGANLVVDGKIGSITLASAKKFDAKRLLVLFLQERLSAYERLSTYEVYGWGWERRVLRIAIES